MDHFAITMSFFLFCYMPVEYETARHIDLSYNFDEETLVWPTEQRYKMMLSYNDTTDDGYWFQVESISTSTRCGTHLAAPCHFAKGKWSVEQIPLNRLISPGVVVDVSNKASSNSDYIVTVEDIKEWEKQHGELPQGVILLIRTGWAQYWPYRSKYYGTNTNDITLLRFPGLSPETAEWIVNFRNISGLGIDTPSIDYGQSRDYKCHRIFAAKNVFHLENVADMSGLNATGFTLYVLPMKLKGASGAACRIVATIPDSECL